MGSPDGTKIVLGLFVSTSAFILSYILLRKYGFRAFRTKPEERELEYENLHVTNSEPSLTPAKEQHHGEEGPPKSSCQEPEKAVKQDPAAAVLEEARDDAGQNQTSFIVLDGGADAATLPEGENGGKKSSDRSSDESSYDVIEDERLAETIEDEDDNKEEDVVNANASAQQKEPEETDLESTLESSIVVVEEDSSNVEKSFYASADENFGDSPLKEGLLTSEEEEKEEAGDPGLSLEQSTTEEESTVVNQSAQATTNESLSSDYKDSISEDVTPRSEETLVPGTDQDTLETDTEPVPQVPTHATPILDTVLEAELQAAAPDTTSKGAPQQERDSQQDLNQATEVLNKCQNTPMNVDKEDIDILVKLLRTNMPELHATVLNSIVRIAAFNQNTTYLRDSGCPEEIVRQLRQTCESVLQGDPGAETLLTSINQVLTNLSLDPKAHPKLEDAIPALVELLLMDTPPDSLVLTTLRPLVNLSGEAPYHGHYVRAVGRLMGLLDTSSHVVKVQSLKVLVNLSLDTEMVPHLLEAETPSSLMALLASPTHNDVILRLVTLLANILTAVREKTVSTVALLSSGECLYNTLSDADCLAILRSRVSHLTRYGGEDVRLQANKLYNCITEASSE